MIPRRLFHAVLALASLALTATGFAQTLAAPILNPDGGRIGPRGQVKVLHFISGVELHYTTNGADPQLTDPIVQVNASLVVDRTQNLRVRAFLPGQAPSAVKSAWYYTQSMGGNGYSGGSIVRPDGRVWEWGATTSPTLVPGISNVSSVSNPSYGHTLYVKQDGTVWGSGSNKFKQIANTTAQQYPNPIQVTGLSDIVQVAVGGDVSDTLPFYDQASALESVVFAPTAHSLALKADGTVWSWGSNKYGVAGLNSTEAIIATPTQILGLTNVVRICIGFGNSYALKADGTVWAWGYGGTGSNGDGTATTRKSPVQVLGLPAIRSISSFFFTTHAIGVDGSLWGWGDNFEGRIGDGTQSRRLKPVKITNVANVVEVCASRSSRTLLTASGSLYAWYYNDYGPKPFGLPNTLRPTLVPSFASRVDAIGYEIIKTKDGSYWGRGYRSGDGTTAERVSPVKLSLFPGEATVLAGRDHTAALKVDGTVWTWGAGLTGVSFLNFDDLAPRVNTSGSWTSNGPLGSAVVTIAPDGQVAKGTSSWYAPPFISTQNSAGFGNAAGVDTTPYLTTGNTMTTGGSVTIQFAGPQRYFGLLWGSVDTYNTLSLYNGATLVKTVTGTEVVAGANGNQGASGTYYVNINTDVPFNRVVATSTQYAFEFDNVAYSSAPVTLAANMAPNANVSNVPAIVPGLMNVVSIGVGERHTLALGMDGTIKAWGRNETGALGDGTTINRSAPVAIAGLSGIAAVSGGDGHSMALDRSGNVFAWGANEFGQLGIGKTEVKITPQFVHNNDVKIAIAAGEAHSLALGQSGNVYAWGRNQFGQLGDGTVVQKISPIQVPGLSDVIAIATVENHSVALKSDGTVWVWGANANGQLGDGTTANRLTPVRVLGLPKIRKISAGDAHTLAIDENSVVWSWGANESGQLGDGTFVQKLTPVRSKISGVYSVSGGGAHTVTMTGDGYSWNFGANALGQLGNARDFINYYNPLPNEAFHLYR